MTIDILSSRLVRSLRANDFFRAEGGVRPVAHKEIANDDVETWLFEQEFDTRYGPMTWSDLCENISSQASEELARQMGLRNWSLLSAAEERLEAVLAECGWLSDLPEQYFDEIVADFCILLWAELLTAPSPDVKLMATGIEWAYRSGLLPCGWPGFPGGTICTWKIGGG